MALDYIFHSTWLDPAKVDYLKFLQELSMQSLKLPFICCVEGSTLTEIPASYLWQVVREPIELIEAEQSWNYVDLGPSGTLATFLKYLVDKEFSFGIHSVMTPCGQELKQIKKLKQTFAELNS